MIKTVSYPEAVQNLNLPDKDRNLFSSPDWLMALVKTYQLKLFVKYIEENGQVVSYIVYSAVRNFLEWKICICSYCDYCDCTVARPEHWQMLIDELRKEYPEYRIAVRNLRDEIVRTIAPLKELSRERFHLLDLRADLPVIWKRTHDSFRAAVRQGEKNGVTVKICGRPELEKFYALHLKIRKNKYRIFPQPYRFFEMIWKQFMENGKGILLGAFSPQGEFIAGNIYLQCGKTFYYKFNTSSLDALKWRPNNLLFWEGIKAAKEWGMEFLDLGSSGYEQKGLILFKNHTGAQMMDIIHLGYEPPGYKFSEKRILRLMTKAFTQPWVPERAVRWGSEIIYPYLA